MESWHVLQGHVISSANEAWRKSWTESVIPVGEIEKKEENIMQIRNDIQIIEEIVEELKIKREFKILHKKVKQFILDPHFMIDITLNS